MPADVPRRAAVGAALAAAVAGAAFGCPPTGPEAGPAPNTPGEGIVRRGGEPLPDHADLWARMPLPFTPAEAWRLLAPEIQAEIGAAVIGMVLADYVSGNGHAEPDLFLERRPLM